ncbi:MAG: hypothetical protein LBS84_11100 [Clostridiales bacterium]|nr:hypothetical protein [Clostridiales bacterium]
MEPYKVAVALAENAAEFIRRLARNLSSSPNDAKDRSVLADSIGMARDKTLI